MDNSVTIPVGTYDTGISTNKGTLQKIAYLFLFMGNWSDGDNTYTKLYLVRTGYNGNHVSATKIAESGDSRSYVQSIGVGSNGNITVTTSLQCRLCIL